MKVRKKKMKKDDYTGERRVGAEGIKEKGNEER
jgi:hypothetical protein